MRARFMKLMAGLAVLGVLAGGGATLASAAKGPASEPVVSEQSSEAPSSEAAGESSSESTPSDGPGGYQDDPGNANADTQFQGEQ